MSVRSGSAEVEQSVITEPVVQSGQSGDGFSGADSDAFGTSGDINGGQQFGGLDAPSPEPARKRRGRPTNAEKAARDSAGLASQEVASDKPAKRVYTRRAKVDVSDAETEADNKPLTATSAEAMLKDLHGFVFAMVMKMPELAPTDDETRELAKSYVKMAKHFPSVNIPKKYEKWVALATFGFVATKVYAPRAAVLIAVAKMQQDARKGNGNKPMRATPPSAFEPAFQSN